MNRKLKPPGELREPERHVVLVAPEVHWNTGNIGRTCLGAGAFLHLIKPLGFSLDAREVRRAGLDYWQEVRLAVWESLEKFISHIQPDKGELALFTKNAHRSFWQLPKISRQILVFGSETKGLPESFCARYPDSLYHIPTSRAIRCLNLSTAVGIALYESLREFRPHHQWLEESQQAHS